MRNRRRGSAPIFSRAEANRVEPGVFGAARLASGNPTGLRRSVQEELGCEIEQAPFALTDSAGMTIGTVTEVQLTGKTGGIVMFNLKQFIEGCKGKSASAVKELTEQALHDPSAVKAAFDAEFAGRDLSKASIADLICFRSPTLTVLKA